MSKRGKDGDYTVGRGKPPVEHRWPKGRSGNLNGRPKKVRGEVLDTENPDIIGLIVSEGCRVVTLNQGETQVTMPMIQAVLRATGVSALKGSALAQRNYAQQFANAVTQQAKFKLEERLAAITLKMQLELERDKWIASGGNEMAMDLHPADIEIGAEEVKNYLAFTAEARENRAKLVRLRDYTLAGLAKSRRAAAAGDDDALLQLQRDIAEGLISTINEQLPPRFRRVAQKDHQSLTVASSPQEVWATIGREVAGRLLRRRDGLA